jgi:hypothetical protein
VFFSHRYVVVKKRLFDKYDSLGGEVGEETSFPTRFYAGCEIPCTPMSDKSLPILTYSMSWLSTSPQRVILLLLLLLLFTVRCLLANPFHISYNAALYWYAMGARVNQQPPMHQLTVLSTRWVAFFHLALDGVHLSPFLFAADHCTFFFLVLDRFSLDLTSHIATLLTFLPSQVLQQPWYLIYYPLDTATLITSYPFDLATGLTTYPTNLATILITYPTNLTTILTT